MTHIYKVVQRISDMRVASSYLIVSYDVVIIIHERTQKLQKLNNNGYQTFRIGMVGAEN